MKKLPLIRRAALDDAEARLADLKAEYANFRSRSKRERETAHQDAQAQCAAAFFPVYDDLSRALAQPCADAAYVTGIEMTMRELKKVFSSFGISEIDALGAPFDPTLHEAIDHVEDPQYGENTVAKIVHAGFRTEDRVLRHAVVCVAN